MIKKKQSSYSRSWNTVNLALVMSDVDLFGDTDEDVGLEQEDEPIPAQEVEPEHQSNSHVDVNGK